MSRGVAVIGARGVGVGHVAALRALPGMDVSVIVGSTPRSAEAAARSLHVPRWSADWQAVLEDEAIAAVHVCTPNNLHFPIAAAALAAGKHVICEKPLTADAADALRLVELARCHDRQLSVVGYKYRYAPLAQLLRAQVLDGTLGRVHEIRGCYLQNWMLDPERSSWRQDTRQGGGNRVLLDIGTHLLDLMETVLAQRLVTLEGHEFSADGLAARGDSGAALDDGAHLLLEFEGGPRGIAALSQVSAAHTHQISITVDGSSGSAHWTLGEVETLTLTAAADNAQLQLDGNTSHATAGRYWRRAGRPDQLLVPLLADAYGRLDAALHDVERAAVPTPDFEAGCRHLQLIQTLRSEPMRSGGAPAMA